MYVYIYIYIDLYVYIYIDLYIYICMYICMYIYIYTMNVCNFYVHGCTYVQIHFDDNGVDCGVLCLSVNHHGQLESL